MANRVTQYLNAQNVPTMNWPPKGVDMSPIENVWSEMARELQKLPVAQNADHLWQQIQVVWGNVCAKRRYWLALLHSPLPN